MSVPINFTSHVRMMNISLISHNANHIGQKFTRNGKFPFDLVRWFKTNRMPIQKGNSFFFGSFSIVFFRRFNFFNLSVISSMSELLEDLFSTSTLAQKESNWSKTVFNFYAKYSNLSIPICRICFSV